MKSSFFDYTVKNSLRKDQPLKEFEGKVCLVVNTASACGFTKQYDGLEKLYKDHKDENFVVIGFPCNQFGSQEAGTDEEIQTFCKTQFDVNFPVMAKVEVNGSNTEPVYEYLKSQAPGLLGIELIKWNFTKFLIGKDGQVIKRYAPQTDPKDIEADILKALS